MQVPVYDPSGNQIENIDLPDEIFGIEPNEAVMHQALKRQLANAHLGTHDTKSRGEVRGGGKKPWKQKGTGRARQGSTRAPHWKGGGRAFGPTPRSYAERMPKRMRQLAIKSALSVKAAENQIRVLDRLYVGDVPKTKAMAELLGNCGIEKTALLLMPKADTLVSRSASNLAGVKALRLSYLNVRDLLGYDFLVMGRDAIQEIQKLLGGQAEGASAEPASALS